MDVYLLMVVLSCTAHSTPFCLHLTRIFSVASDFTNRMVTTKQVGVFITTCVGTIVGVFTLALSSCYVISTRSATGFDGCTTSDEHSILICGTLRN